MTPPNPKKILVALAYWDGDKAQAERLARFVEELEEKIPVAMGGKMK